MRKEKQKEWFQVLQCRLPFDERKDSEHREYLVNEFLHILHKTRGSGYILVIKDVMSILYLAYNGGVTGVIESAKVFNNDELDAADDIITKLREVFKFYRITIMHINEHITQDLKGELYYEHYHFA